MPTHFMSEADIQKEYGEIKGFTKPIEKLEGSKMNLDEGDVVGEVILQGKREYWG